MAVKKQQQSSPTPPEPAIVDIPEKSTPLQPGPPVPVPSALGATFAERRAARLKAVQASENKSVQRAETK